MVDQKPVTLTATLSERSVPVHVDAAMLVRTVRYMLSDGGSSGPIMVRHGDPGVPRPRHRRAVPSSSRLAEWR